MNSSQRPRRPRLLTGAQLSSQAKRLVAYLEHRGAALWHPSGNSPQYTRNVVAAALTTSEINIGHCEYGSRQGLPGQLRFGVRMLQYRKIELTASAPQAGLETLLEPLRANHAPDEEIQRLKEQAWAFYSSQKSQTARSTSSEPLSFAELVAYIKSGQDPPGIQKVDETRLSNQSSDLQPPDLAAQPGAGKKPWELS